MAENNFSALVQLIVDKAQARSALQRELKELQKEAQLETDVKINLSDVRQARKEIAQANREQQEGTRENIKLRAQELANTRMLAKEIKANADLESAQSRQSLLQTKARNKETIEGLKQERLLLQENRKLEDERNKKSSTQKNLDRIQLSLDTEKYSKDIKGISDELAKVGKFTLSDKSNEDIFKKANDSAKSLQSTYNQLKTIMADANATDQQKIDIENKYQQELTTTKNLLSQIKLSKDDELVSVGDSKRVNMIATLNSYLAKNTAMTKENKNQIETWIAKLGSSDDMTVGAIKNINSEFKQLDATLRKTGQLGLSTWDKFKQAVEKFGGWSLVTGAITKMTSEVGKAVTELIELDNILTEISKTSDLTEQQLKKLGDTAFDTASKYGKKASDYLTGVQEMYRAGFDNASEMAELSVLAQSAGDMDTTIANDYILATNAAYKYKGSVEELNKVLDSQNYITNNAAISMKDIADATTETASVAAQYGVQIDELSALIATATANTRESGSEVGTALKAILINLQDTTSKPVTDTFDALGISMTKVVNGAETLKTPIELIHELADAYNSLPEGDIMRANILNEIGQKRHAKVCVVI